MRLLSVSVLLFAATVLQAQVVLTVDDDLPADFETIQAAIDAAPEGATILVGDGFYEAFSVLDKALVVTADQGANVRVYTSPSHVTSLAAEKSLVLRGLRFSDGNLGLRDVLVVEDCAGTVWIEAATIGGLGFSFGGTATTQPASLLVEDSVVVLVRTTVTGMGAWSPLVPAPLGLHARNSSVHLFESQVVGGKGGQDEVQVQMSSGVGGVGLAQEGGLLFAASSVIRGGQGGRGGGFLPCTGGVSGLGGAGLVLDGGEAHLLGGTLAGGPGGFVFALPGACAVGPEGLASEVIAGTLLAVAWPAHGFAVASPVREGESATATFTGPPGEFAWYLFSEHSQALFLPQVLGTLVLDFPLFLVPVGALDAGGQAQVALAPALAPGAGSQVFLLQSLFLDGVSGTFTLSSPASLVVLAGGS